MLVINGRLNSFLPKTNHIGTHHPYNIPSNYYTNNNIPNNIALWLAIINVLVLNI